MRISIIALLCSLAASSAQAQAPWLPEADQAKMRTMLPEGVPFSDTARFYRLPQVYQSMIVLNDRPNTTLHTVDDRVTEHPWRVSGGMHAVARDAWRNATALDLGDGKIELWHELVDAGAPQPVWRRFWRFPVGTLAYDVLIRRWPLGEERVFEVRIHERLKSGWGNARTFRPAVAAEGQRWVQTWRFTPTLVFANLTQSRIDMPAKGSTVSVKPIVERVAFVDREDLPHDDGYLIPTGYAGAGLSCAACHSPNLVGQRTGYGAAIRGNDGRFSWHPWGPDGQLDRRWPLVERNG